MNKEELKEWLHKEIEDPENYDIDKNGWSLCPVCRKHKFVEKDMKEEYPQCPVCGWLFDEVQTLSPNTAAVNVLSVYQAREVYKKYGTIDVDNEMTRRYIEEHMKIKKVLREVKQKKK